MGQALCHPRVYPHSSDDFSPPPEEISQHIDCEKQLYVGCEFGGVFLGCFLFAPHNHILYEVHTMLLPAAWGPTALLCARAAQEWLWRETPARRLVTSVPGDNVLALRFAQKCGFVEYGLNPRSIQKGGILLDQHLLGTDRPAQGEF